MLTLGETHMKKILASLLLALLLVGCTQAPASGSAGGKQSLQLKGSDTELQMFAALAEEFKKSNADVDITVTGGGSGTGIAALINGEIDIADSSRSMKAEEIEKAKKNGIEPVEFIVARDGLAVIVNPDNPVKELTRAQVADIYKGTITNWKDVGGNDEVITLYGRQSTSGTYVYFRDTVLKADYATSMRNMEGTAAIVDAVSADKTGIGYIGIGYLKASVKPLSLEGQNPADKAAVKSGAYALTRPLFQYTKGVPAKEGAAHKLMQFQLSEQGQAVVEKTGFLGITAADKAANDKQLARIG